MNSNTHPKKITPAFRTGAPVPDARAPGPHFDAVTVAVLAGRSSAPLARLPYANAALPALVKDVAEALNSRELTAAYLDALPRLRGAMEGGWSLVVQGVTSGFGINPRAFHWSCVRVDADGHVFPWEIPAGRDAGEPNRQGPASGSERGAQVRKGGRRQPFPFISSAAAAATRQRAGARAGRNPAAFLSLTYAVQKRGGHKMQTVECELPPRAAAMLLAASQLPTNSPARLCCSVCGKVARLSHNCARCAKPLMCGACAKLRGAAKLACAHAACRLERDGAAPAVRIASVCPRCHTARPRDLAQLPCPTCLHGPGADEPWDWNEEPPNERRAA